LKNPSIYQPFGLVRFGLNLAAVLFGQEKLLIMIMALLSLIDCIDLLAYLIRTLGQLAF